MTFNTKGLADDSAHAIALYRSPHVSRHHDAQSPHRLEQNGNDEWSRSGPNAPGLDRGKVLPPHDA